MKNIIVSSGNIYSNQADEAPNLANGVEEVAQEPNKVLEKGSLGSIETPFGTFTKDGKYLVVVSPNGNLSLFQTNVDSLVSESKTGKFIDRRILEFTSRVPLATEQRKKKKSKQKAEQVAAQLISSKAGRVTCLAISYQSVPVEESKTVKRRKQTSESNDEVIIAVGFHLGEVLLRKSRGFSDLEVFDGCPESIQAHNKRQVSAICFSEDATKMFSSGYEGDIVVWERTSLNSPPYPKKRIVHGSSRAINFLACNKRGTRLAVGDTEVTLYDVDKEMQLLHFRGHSNPISGLVFFLEDSFLVSCSMHENNAYIWNCDEETPKASSDIAIGDVESHQTSHRELNGQVDSKRALKRIRSSDNVHMPRIVSGVLRSNFPTRFVNVLFEDSNKKCCLITCILADGTVSGYQVSVEEFKEGAPNVLESPSFTTNISTSDDAVFATAMDSTGTFVLFAHGGFLKPIVEAVSLSELERGSSVQLEPKERGGVLRVSSAFSHSNEASTRLVKHLREEREAEILSTTQVSVTSQTVLEESNEQANNRELESQVTQTGDNEEEKTLEAKLNHLNVNEPSVESVPNKRLERRKNHPRQGLETSVRILEQAVIHRDQKLLEKALASLTDRKQIQRTVGKLGSTCVVPLLRELILRFESSPNRAKVLLVWIQSILIRHASFLSSTGELVDELKRLQEVMEIRMDVFQSILELEGRLQLIISHSKRNIEDQKDEQPMFEYKEESSEASYTTDSATDE